MFGYIRPCKSELRVREFENYQAMYCGLCHALSKRYGFFMRNILNYDLSFLALTLSSAEHCNCTKCRKRCIASPIRKKTYYQMNDALAFCADVNVILAYWKWKDQIADEGFWTSLLYRVLLGFLSPAYRKAARLRPQFAEACKEGLHALHDIEEARTASVDAAAHAFAKILESVAEFAKQLETTRKLQVLFYHIGRWVYILDAWDDIEEDFAKDNYNPIILRYEMKKEHDREEILKAIRLTLEHSAATAAGAAELIDFDENGTIIKNVLYLGLPVTAEAVLNGKLDKRSNMHGSI